MAKKVVVAKVVKNKKPWLKKAKSIGYILAVCGALGLIAASVLMVEKIALLKDPNYNPSCNLNPIISCGSVMKTDQASAFGFSNSILGIAGFSVIMTIGFAILAGAQFKRWFWRGIQVGTMFGVGFSMWLFYEGIYTIKAVCPYCALIWVVMITMFVYVTLYNFLEGHVKTPAKLKRVVAFAQDHHADIVLGWCLILVAIILNRFWYYWETLL